MENIFPNIIPFENGHTAPSAEALDEVSSQFLTLAYETLDHAFQPIVDIHNGTVYGYEALVRNHEKMGFDHYVEAYDRALELGVLYRFDLMMREKAVIKFKNLPKTHTTKIFIPIDNRSIRATDFYKGGTQSILEKHDIAHSIFCAEISENNIESFEDAIANIQHFQERDYLCALDDFGTGYSGLQLLKNKDPDLIKIDRNFVHNIAHDKKSKLIVSTLCGMAHVLGLFVIAKSVQSELDLKVCKEAGCDLVQGSYICEPSDDLQIFKKQYEHVQGNARRKTKNTDNDSDIIYEKIEYRPPLRVDDTMVNVLDAFRRNKEINFFPVVDESGSPLGIIHERTIKEYTYSPFGMDLIANKGTGLNVRKFLSPCPVADINSSAQSILEKYSMTDEADGIIIVKQFGYLGFLSAASLLQVINEKNLAMARDCSPLTKLPGNSSITDFVNRSLSNQNEASSLIYFDLDNFKAFNDVYGFRQGDRAILLFAELMQKYFNADNMFLGHVGGDDFFIGVWSKHFDQTEANVIKLLSSFKKDIVGFYDRDAREKGYLVAKDRQGNMTNFPLMSCSGAIINLHVNRSSNNPTHFELDQAIATLKKQAKASDTHLAISQY